MQRSEREVPDQIATWGPATTATHAAGKILGALGIECEVAHIAKRIEAPEQHVGPALDTMPQPVESHRFFRGNAATGHE